MCKLEVSELGIKKQTSALIFTQADYHTISVHRKAKRDCTEIS